MKPPIFRRKLIWKGVTSQSILVLGVAEQSAQGRTFWSCHHKLCDMWGVHGLVWKETDRIIETDTHILHPTGVFLLNATSTRAQTTFWLPTGGPWHPWQRLCNDSWHGKNLIHESYPGFLVSIHFWFTLETYEGDNLIQKLMSLISGNLCTWSHITGLIFGASPMISRICRRMICATDLCDLTQTDGSYGRLRQLRRRIAWHKARHTQRTGRVRSPQHDRQCWKKLCGYLLACQYFNQLVAAENKNRKHLDVQFTYFLDFRTYLRQIHFLAKKYGHTW